MIINQFYINKDGNYHEFSLIHYISARSFLECNSNCKLILHTNRNIISRWVMLLNSEYPDRFSIEYIPENLLQYDKYDSVSHLVDFLKIHELQNCRRSSMIVDSDFVCLKSLESWFNSDDDVVIISEERDPVSHHYSQLALGWCIARPNSRFIDSWYNKILDYEKGKGWTYWAGVIPDKLWREDGYDIKVIPEQLTDPYTYTRDKLADLFLHNKDMDDSYMFHVAESISWDRYLKPLDLEHIMTVDTTFTRSVRSYVSHLWDSNKNVPKIAV